MERQQQRCEAQAEPRYCKALAKYCGHGKGVVEAERKWSTGKTTGAAQARRKWHTARALTRYRVRVHYRIRAPTGGKQNALVRDRGNAGGTCSGWSKGGPQVEHRRGARGAQVSGAWFVGKSLVSDV